MSSLKDQRNSNELGAGLVEYALLVGLISVISIAGISAFGQNVSEKFEDVAVEVVKAGTKLGSGCSQGNEDSCGGGGGDGRD